jgi:hypothetical protein
MGSRRKIRACLSAATAAAALLGGTPPEAAGQDRMRSMGTFQDPSGRMKIDMPGKPLVRGASKEPGLVAMAWETDVDDDRSQYDLMVHLGARQHFANPVFLGTRGLAGFFGTPLAGTGKAAAGEWREEWTAGAEHYWVRAIAADGVVYVACIQAQDKRAESLRPQAETILGTFRAEGGWQIPLTLPDTFQNFTAGECEVWSDLKKEELDQLLKEASACVAAFARMEPGEPVMKGPPRIVVFSKEEEFLESDPLLDASFTCFHHQPARAVVVTPKGRADPAFQGNFRRAMAQMLSARWLGGSPPPWIGLGFGEDLWCGMTNGGKHEKSVATSNTNARAAATKSNRTLEKLMALDREDAATVREDALELYAWRFFFRYSKAQKTWGARYDKTLKAIRATGDLREAMEAWKGTDHAKLHREFLDWTMRWREGKP